MGVYHFMGVGRAVGAVTCAVSYIEKALDLIADDPATEQGSMKKRANDEIVKLFHGSGGISHAESDRGKIEALVLFTSPEVIQGKLKSFPYTGCDQPGSVREELVRNLKTVWKHKPQVGRKIFWCEVDIDDYQDCFNKIIQVAYRFSPSGKQGKEIWCNLTGGSNSIGFALLSMARLTGMSTKHYLISQKKEFQKEVRLPSQIKIQPNKDGYFNVMPFLKTRLEIFEFYDVLEEMEKLGESVTTTELFNRLRYKHPFTDASFEDFKRHYMLKLYGLGYTEYDVESDRCSLSESGQKFIGELEGLEYVFELEEKISTKKIDMVAESKTWPWFSVQEI